MAKYSVPSGPVAAAALRTISSGDDRVCIGIGNYLSFFIFHEQSNVSTMTARASMDHKYAALEAMVLSFKQNYRLRRAPRRVIRLWRSLRTGQVAGFASRTPS